MGSPQSPAKLPGGTKTSHPTQDAPGSFSLLKMVTMIFLQIRERMLLPNSLSN
jgi:hypothetical protein